MWWREETKLHHTIQIMDTKIHCELCNGSVAATGIFTWGLFERTDPMNTAHLCSKHSDDLYDKCRGAINTNLMYWLNTPFK